MKYTRKVSPLTHDNIQLAYILVLYIHTYIHDDGL